jgi:nucleoside-diphosphate-sugar epimerase
MTHCRPNALRASFAYFMRTLVLGGTQFIGRQIVLELLRAGDAVTILSRGVTPDDLPAEVERLRGDRDRGSLGLSQLEGRQWDACIDVNGYTAVHVNASVSELQRRVGRYVFISAVAVYGHARTGPLDEGTPVVEAAPEHVTDVVGDMYGRLKVTCERIVRAALGQRATILRPQIVVGPHDHTPRLTYWIRRAQQVGSMLAPGDGSDFLQVVDVKDVARFAALAVERDLSGTYNLAGERVTWSSFFDMLRPREVCWVSRLILEQADPGETHLPLYRPAGSLRSGLMHVSHNCAVNAGFIVTPLRTSVEQVRAWVAAANPDTQALNPHVERRLIERQVAQRR